MFLTSNPGLTCWKHWISVFLSDFFGLKRNEPTESEENTSLYSQIPTVAVAYFVVSQMTPCISEDLLSFPWMLSFHLKYQIRSYLSEIADFIHSLPIRLANTDCRFWLCICYWKQFCSPSFKTDFIWICYLYRYDGCSINSIKIQNLERRKSCDDSPRNSSSL